MQGIVFLISVVVVCYVVGVFFGAWWASKDRADLHDSGRASGWGNPPVWL